jgi:hypothetical protein
MGMKMPLMNINGKRTRFDSIITFDGLSVGGDDSRLPNAEKQKADRIISIARMNGLTTLAPKANIPTSSGTIEITAPYRKPENISPKIIAGIEAGVEINRSSVRIRVSQGATIGLAEDAVKNSVIPTRPGSSILGEIFLPMAKAKNKQSGKRMPKIKTGDFK